MRKDYRHITSGLHGRKHHVIGPDGSDLCETDDSDIAEMITLMFNSMPDLLLVVDRVIKSATHTESRPDPISVSLNDLADLSRFRDEYLRSVVLVSTTVKTTEMS